MDNEPLDALLGYPVTYHICVGPQAGRKVLTLPACDPDDHCGDTVDMGLGFSLHIGVAARAQMWWRPMIWRWPLHPS